MGDLPLPEEVGVWEEERPQRDADYTTVQRVEGARPELVYRFMTRPAENYARLHPLLDKATVTARAADGGSETVEVAMEDRLTVCGCVPWRVPYAVHQQMRHGPREILSRVRAAAGVRMWQRFTFDAEGGGAAAAAVTVVRQEVYVTAKRKFVAESAVRQAKEAHAKFLGALCEVDWSRVGEDGLEQQ